MISGLGGARSSPSVARDRADGLLLESNCREGVLREARLYCESSSNRFGQQLDGCDISGWDPAELARADCFSCLDPTDFLMWSADRLGRV